MSGQGSVSTNGLKPTYNASGLTTITNPAAPGKVLIIHTNKHRSLSLEHRGIGDKQSANKIEPEKFEEFIPELLYPSDLVTRHYDNWLSLYGVVKEKTKGTDDKPLENPTIALLSPIYRTLDGEKPKNGILTGLTETGTDDFRSYLFFHGSEAEGAKPVIYSKDISAGASGDSPLDLTNYLSDTHLAAVYDPSGDKPYSWLFYQGVDGNIHGWNVNERTDIKIADSTAVADKGTPIGAIFVPEDAANNIKARIYVYTIDSSRQLRASWAAAGGEILKFGPFESALGGSTQKVDFNTQISVLPAPKINYVYVHLANSSEVSIISHKLKA